MSNCLPPEQRAALKESKYGMAYILAHADTQLHEADVRIADLTEQVRLLQADNDILRQAASRGPNNCYCVCHSPFSSSGYCRHCKGDNEVGQYHELRVLTKKLAEALDGVLADIGTTTDRDEALLDEARATGVLQ